MRVQITANPLRAELAVQLDIGEARDVAEVGARPETYTLAFSEDGKLQGYAVFEPADLDGYFVIYMARSMVKGLAGVVLKSLFGVSVTLGTPLRVHTTKLEAMARMMGADLSSMIKDADGLPMGVFDGV